MSEKPDHPGLPKRAKFERQVQRDPAELGLMKAIRGQKRKGSDRDAKIAEILERAAKEIEAL